MEQTQIEALRAHAHNVRYQFYAREDIADALELIAANQEAEKPEEGSGYAEQVAALDARLDKLEALLLQLAPPSEPVAEQQAAGTDTNVGA
jgi:hypothetical protein